MSHRKIRLSSSVARATEAVRQALEVEFGSRIELTQLDIETTDPIRHPPKLMPGIGVVMDMVKVMLSGKYCQLDVMTKSCFMADVTLCRGASEIWFPDWAWITVTQPRNSVSKQAHEGNYGVEWRLQDNLKMGVIVTLEGEPGRDYTNVGFGYAPGERWRGKVEKTEEAA